jgi:hypothetical protein
MSLLDDMQLHVGHMHANTQTRKHANTQTLIQHHPSILRLRPAHEQCALAACTTARRTLDKVYETNTTVAHETNTFTATYQNIARCESFSRVRGRRRSHGALVRSSDLARGHRPPSPMMLRVPWFICCQSNTNEGHAKDTKHT